MKSLILLLALACSYANAYTVFDSVKIGDHGPFTSPSAVLEISTTTGATLLSRVTTTQKNALVSPTNGMLVYDTTLNSFSGYQNGSWSSIGGSAAWGAITGTLSAQTDLQNALNLKANLASPTFSGTVTGTFSGNLTGNVTGNTSGSAGSFTGSLLGDVTGTQGATVVGKINGTSLAGLSTGILKNTTTTGVPSIAIAADFPTLNQSTTGNAATVTTNANLTGPVISTGNATAVTSNAITNTMLAQMGAKTVKGNNTTSTANAVDMTVAQLNLILPVFTSTLNGSVPLSGGGTTNFLRADGSWQPAGVTTNPLVFTQTTTPAAPASGFDNMYFKLDDNLYIQNHAGVETLVNLSNPAANYYVSSQVTSSNSTITSGTYVTISTSPALTITPLVSGTWEVWSPLPIFPQSGATACQVRIFNTSGGATLVSENPATADSASGYVIAPGQPFSLYTLTAGTTYIFDIQQLDIGSAGSGCQVGGGLSSYYMYAKLYSGTIGSGSPSAYASAYFSSLATWSTIGVNSIGDPTYGGSSYVLTTRPSSSGLTLTAAGSNLPGITFTPPSATAVYFISVQVSELGFGSNGTCALQLADGSNNVLTVPGGNAQNSAGANAYITQTLTTTFAPGTTSPVTVKVQTGSNNGANCYMQSAFTNANTIEWTVFQVNSQGNYGISSLGSFGSAPNANGALLNGSTLTLEPASSTQPGGLTTGTQTIAGSKTFGSNASDAITLGGLSSTATHMFNGGQAVTIITIFGNRTLDSTTNDYVIRASPSSALTITLTAATNGRTIRIVDVSGTAATNNITITPNGADTINGNANLIINLNNGSVDLVGTQGTGWNIL